MKLSQKSQSCNLSPMRKFHPYAVAARARGIKIYGMNIGQPDIATPRAYFDAVAQFNEPVVEYAPSAGIPEILTAIQAYYRNLGMDYAQDEVFVTTGGSEALQILMLSILDEGSEVITPEPFYPNYHTFITAAGGVVRPLPTTAEEGYRYADASKLEALINDKTRAILVTNPGNPTGTVMTPEEVRIVADVAKKHDLYLIADEVYREFIYSDEPMSSIGQLEDMQQHVIIIDSVSKRFSACGARIGALITRNKPLQQQIMKFCQGRLSVATLDQVAAAALYTAGSDYFSSVRDEYQKRRDTCYEKLMEIPGVVCKKPEGAFYLMAKLPVDDADALQTFLLSDFDYKGHTMMYAPGAGFYTTPNSGLSEIRLAYVINQQAIANAMEVLKEGIRAYNAR